MEPLSKEEIDEMEANLFKGLTYLATARLFFTARLGAEFVKQTSHKEQP